MNWIYWTIIEQWILIQFKSCIGFDLTRLYEVVRKLLKEASEAAESAFEDAKAKVLDAKKYVNIAQDHVKKWQKGILSVY